MIERLRLGQIVNAVGLKGETRVYPYTDYKERFQELSWLYVQDQVYEIQRVRYMGQMVIIKFQGVEDRNEAERLKGSFLYVDRENARKLGEDEYFIADLVGLLVTDLQGNPLGTLSWVYQNGAQDVYEVTPPDEEGKKQNPFLIPAVGEFIKEVDLQNRRMTVALIEGMR